MLRLLLSHRPVWPEPESDACLVPAPARPGPGYGLCLRARRLIPVLLRLKLDLVSKLDRSLDFVLDPVEELVLALGPVGIGWGLGPGTCTLAWVWPILVGGVWCCG